jgi:hypothetical protein
MKNMETDNHIPGFIEVIRMMKIVGLYNSLPALRGKQGEQDDVSSQHQLNACPARLHRL